MEQEGEAVGPVPKGTEPPHATLRLSPRRYVYLLVCIDVVLCMTTWQVADVLLVTSPSYSPQDRMSAWLLWTPFAIAFIGGWLAGRRLHVEKPMRSSVRAIAIALPILLVLVLTILQAFHLLIGGRM